MKTFRIYHEVANQETISMDTARRDEQGRLYCPTHADDVGDEYHTMHELYEHRMALTIALFNFMYMVDVSIRGEQPSYQRPLYMKSKLHHDGTMFEGGYFIVMAITPEGQISYHYKLKHWDKFRIPEVERTPEWDGHGSLQVMERLMKL